MRGWLSKAIEFSEYLESHGRRCYGSGRQSEVDTAKAIISRLRKRDLPIIFTVRDILQEDWSNLSSKEQVTAGLELLENADWVRSQEIKTGR